MAFPALHAKKRISGGLVFGGSLAVTLLAACGGGGSDDSGCHNLPKAGNVIGQADYVSDQSNRNGDPNGNTVASPLGSVASNGTLFYLPDTANNRVLGFTSVPTAAGASAAFALGQDQLTTNAPGGGATSLSKPGKVSVSGDGSQLVVADTANNRVLIWNSLPQSNVAPDVVIGISYSSGSSACSDDGTGTLIADRLSNPLAAMIATGPSGKPRLLVVDQGNNRVLIWNDASAGTLASGQAADVILGQGSACGVTAGTFTAASGTTPATIGLTNPTDLWTDGYNLFVVDSGNNRVLYWNQVPIQSNLIATNVVGQTGAGTSAFSLNGAHTAQNGLSAPNGVGSDGTRFYVADTGNNRVLVFSSFPLGNGGNASGVFGQADFSHGAYNDADQNGTAGDQSVDPANLNSTQGTLHTPTGVFARGGQVWVTDRDNQRVLAFPLASAVDGSDPTFCN